MADARDQALPLVTTGDPDFVEHDWYSIFSSLGVLNYDTKIAAVVRILGWYGMLGCVVWLAFRVRAKKEEGQSVPATFPKPAISLLQRYPGKNRTTPPSPPAEKPQVEIPTAPSPR